MKNVLVVGSSLIDLFIDVENNGKIKNDGKTVTFELGDKIPIDIKALSLGGNGGNVASALMRLGIQSSFYTYLGEDVLSTHIRTTLEKEGVSLYIETEQTVTGSLSLIFDFQTDRVIFSHHNVSPHPFDQSKITMTPDLVFLSSVGREWEDAYRTVSEYSKTNSLPLAVSPGSLQLMEKNEALIDVLHQSKMLFCNIEEAQTIYTMLSGEKREDAKTLLLGLRDYGFDLLSVTAGENGAYAADGEGTLYKIPSLKEHGHEKTGAGDAYTGAFLASYLQDLPIEECMKRGTLNALGVMSHIGAHTGQLRKEEMDQKVWQVDLKAEII